MLVLNNAQIDAQEAKERSALQEAAAPTPLVNALAAHIRTCWEQAKRAKTDVEKQLLINHRQREMEYEADKLAAIKAIDGVEVYMGVTSVKCRNAKDWIRDILFQPGTRPWDIEPTPLPELPEDLRRQIGQRVYLAMMEQAMAPYLAAGQMVPIQEIAQQVAMSSQQAMPEFQKLFKEAIKEQAKEIAKDAEEKIDDQLQEGGFYQALEEALPNIILKTGFLKGPIYRKEKSKRLISDYQTNRSTVGIHERIIPQYESPSPYDIYPAPDSNGINDGFLIEKIRLTGTQLSSMIGLPGYDQAAIRRVLHLYGSGGLQEWTATDTERAQVQKQDTSAIHDSTKISCLEFWGEVQGKTLLEWGMTAQQIPDADIFYPITAWLIGSEVIAAVLNPDPLGDKCYSKASWDDSNGTFWGKGLPEVIKDIQQICNASARALIKNVGLASGPQVEVDKDRYPHSGKMTPWKIWETTSDQMSKGTAAIRFYTPPLIATQLMEIYERFTRIADEHSGVPAYAHGGQDVRGAGDTASGLSMLMTGAARGIKGIVRTIDTQIIAPCVERQYYLNIAQIENAALVADFKIVAKGSSSLMAKEQQAIRRVEFLRDTGNPLDAQIIGPEGRRYLLKEVARSHELDPEKAVPDQPMLPAAQPGMPMSGSPGSMVLNAAGEPVAGQDFALNQNRPKEAPREAPVNRRSAVPV